MSLNSLFCTEYLEEKLNVESFQSIFIKKPQSPLTLKMIENIGIETSTKKDIKAYDLLDYRFFSTLTSVEQKVKLLMNLPLPNKKPLQKPNIFTVLPTIEALQIIQSKNQIITLHKDHYLCSWSLKTLTFKSGDLKLFNNTENYKIISIFSLNDENLLLIFNQAIIRVNLKSFKIRGTNFNISSPIQHSLLQSNRFLIITNFLGKLQVFDLETFDFKPFNRENKWIDIHASHLQGPITCIVGVEDWVVAGGRDGNIKIWRVGEEKVKNFSAHPVEVRAVSLSMNKYFIASAGEDKKITLWTQTSDSFKCVWSKKFTDRTVLNLTFNFDSSKLLMKTQSQIVYFDLVNGEKSEVRYYEYAKIVGDFPGVVEIIDGFNK
jgi:WD40 repeat protein